MSIGCLDQLVKSGARMIALAARVLSGSFSQVAHVLIQVVLYLVLAASRLNQKHRVEGMHVCQFNALVPPLRNVPLEESLQSARGIVPCVLSGIAGKDCQACPVVCPCAACCMPVIADVSLGYLSVPGPLMQPERCNSIPLFGSFCWCCVLRHLDA